MNIHDQNWLYCFSNIAHDDQYTITCFEPILKYLFQTDFKILRFDHPFYFLYSGQNQFDVFADQLVLCLT